VTVEVIYNKQMQYQQLMGFPLIEKGGNRLKMKLKNAYSGKNQLAFIQFKLDKPSKAITEEPVIIKLRYTALRTNKVVEQESKVFLEWQEGATDYTSMFDAQEKKGYTVAVMNQSLKSMSDKFHAGDLAGAKAALQNGLETLKRVNPQVSDQDLKELKETLENYLDVLVRQG
jgi:hypothetical protein